MVGEWIMWTILDGSLFPTTLFRKIHNCEPQNYHDHLNQQRCANAEPVFSLDLNVTAQGRHQ